MMSMENGVAECPFSGHGVELVDVKFFRGRRDDVISSDEIIEQFRSASVQCAQRTADISASAPISRHPVMDVRELIAAL